MHKNKQYNESEIAALADALERSMKAGIAHIRNLNSRLAQKFGETYTGDEKAKEYYDKFNNNTSPPYMIAQTLKVYVKNPALPAPDMMKALQDLAQWKSLESDKPAGPGDTKPRAIYRTLQHLEEFIETHRSEFNEQEWGAFNTDLAGVRHCVAELHKHVRTAERICNSISPDSHAR